MGQQQLLLLVLSIVLVGLAVVVGIQAFTENQRKSMRDAMTNDLVNLGSQAQAWMLKPTAYGGPAEEEGFASLTIPEMGYRIGDDGMYETEYGKYHILQQSEECVMFQAIETDVPEGIGVEDYSRYLIGWATVTGPGVDDIVVSFDVPTYC